jgi:CRISPR system Cascade subunit CasE
MIASLVMLDRQAIQALQIHDSYAMHKFVYNLFPGNNRKFLYYDQGELNNHRKILLISEEQPIIPEQGKIESKYIPESFFHHHKYAFQVLLNPVEQHKGQKSKTPIIQKNALIEWFARKQIFWGFVADPDSIEVFNLGVQVTKKASMDIIHNKAEFRGVLQVVDRNCFIKSFTFGIGRGKAFGFGLLQLRPLNKFENEGVEL